MKNVIKVLRGTFRVDLDKFLGKVNPTQNFLFLFEKLHLIQMSMQCIIYKKIRLQVEVST